MRLRVTVAAVDLLTGEAVAVFSSADYPRTTSVTAETVWALGTSKLAGLPPLT